MKLTRAALLEELRQLVAADAEALHAAQRAAIEGATHDEAKPENDKDTRGLEQSYLARGQAMRVEALRAEVAALQSLTLAPFVTGAPIALSALVELSDDGVTRWVFLVPGGAGKSLAQKKVLAVTLASPLGQALLGKHAGDSFQLTLGAREREIEILSVLNR